MEYRRQEEIEILRVYHTAVYLQKMGQFCMDFHIVEEERRKGKQAFSSPMQMSKTATLIAMVYNKSVIKQNKKTLCYEKSLITTVSFHKDCTIKVHNKKDIKNFSHYNNIDVCSALLTFCVHPVVSFELSEFFFVLIYTF